MPNYIKLDNSCSANGGNIANIYDVIGDSVRFISDCKKFNNESDFLANNDSYLLSNKNPLNNNDTCSIFNNSNKKLFFKTSSDSLLLISVNYRVVPNENYEIAFNLIKLENKSYDNFSIYINGQKIDYFRYYNNGVCNLDSLKFSYYNSSDTLIYIDLVYNSNSTDIFGIADFRFNICNCPILPTLTKAYNVCQNSEIKLIGRDKQNFINIWYPKDAFSNPYDSHQNIIATKNDTIYLESQDIFTKCIYYDTITIYTYNKTVDIDTAIISDCLNEIVKLYTHNNYKSYKWVDKNSGKVVSSEKEYYLSQNGDYYLSVIDSNGCELTSDIINISSIDTTKSTYTNLIFTLNQDSLECIDSTMYLQQKCNSITITNNSLKNVRINDAYISRNTNFSVPLHQLPITIPAKDTANLIVCFNPNNLGEYRDTMYVTDDCKEYRIPLLSYGIIDYQNNDSKCNVALKFSDYILPNNYSVVFNSPIPNPSNSIVNIKYEITRPFDKNIEISSCISDILGNKLFNYTNTISSSILIDGVVKEKGTITYNVEELASGTYLLLCTIQGNFISFPIAINK